MARDWGLRVCLGGVVCCSVVGGWSGFVDDQGSQEEEEGLDGVAGGGGCCWVLDWEVDDCVSFRSMFMNMAISRSVELDSASAGGVWVGAVGAGGGGVVAAGDALSREPSGLGDEDCQNQPMVMMVSTSVEVWWMCAFRLIET